ncbi:hypothetical protein TNCV_2016731 [Trichonephila clavipes]|nr:hypothetical protein TNCV_2016731 [Trichonephila clavipes]
MEKTSEEGSGAQRGIMPMLMMLSNYRRSELEITGTCLKRRHCAAPVSSFVVQRIRVAVSLYAALSSEAEVVATILSGHAAPDVFSPFVRILGMLQTSHHSSGYWACCKHAHFQTNGPRCGCILLQGRLHNMSVLYGVSHGRVWRF